MRKGEVLPTCNIELREVWKTLKTLKILEVVTLQYVELPFSTNCVIGKA